MLLVDLDGTLLDVRRRVYGAYRAAVLSPKVRGQPLTERQYLLQWLEGRPYQERLAASRIFPPALPEYFARFEAGVESEEALRQDSLRGGALTFLKRMSGKAPLVLITQRGRPQALEVQLEALQIRRFFSEVLSGAPPRSRRPDPAGRAAHKYELVRARLSRVPPELTLLGDTETDRAVARKLGCRCLLVEGGHRDRARLIAAAPDAIAADPAAALSVLLAGGRWQR